MKSIEDAARDYQRSDESDGTTATAFEHGAEWMRDGLTQEFNTAKRAEFNRGWWVCFNAFACHILTFRRYDAPNEHDIIDVMVAAGVTPQEIRDVLSSPNIGFDSLVAQWLRDYCDRLK